MALPFNLGKSFSFLDKKDADPVATLGVHGRDDLTSYLNFRHYDPIENIYTLDDGVGFTIAVIPMVGVSQQRFDRLNGLLGNLVPDNATVQVTHISHNKIGSRLANWSKKWVRKDPMFQLMNKKKREYWAKHANEPLGRSRSTLLREHVVLFSVSMEDCDPETFQDLLEFKVNCLSNLNSIFGFASPVEPSELITLMSSLLNPSDNSIEPPKEYDDSRPINEQIIARDTAFYTDARYVKTESYISADPMKNDPADKYDIVEKEIRCFEVSKFPTYVNFGLVASLLGNEFDSYDGHHCPVIQCVNIFYPPAESSLATFEALGARAKQVASSVTGKWNVETRERGKDFERAQQSLVEGGRVVKLSMYGAVIGSPDKASSAQKAARSIYQSLQFNVQYPDKVHLPMFLMTLPMCGNFGVGKFLTGFSKRHTHMSNMVTSILPIFGEHFGTRKGGLFMSGRNGQVLEWGPFVMQGEGNNNTVCLGASGSGKSVLTSEVITNHVARGQAAFVIDNGYSFDKLCSLLGGKHYEFTTRSEFCLNLFDLIDNESCVDHVNRLSGETISGTDYLNERLELCRAVFALMIFGDKILSAEENGVLMDVCKRAWDQFGNSAGANEVAQIIRNYESDSASLNCAGMYSAMLPFINEGSFEKMFNGKNTLDVDSDLVVFELKPLENNKRLRDIIMVALFGVIDLKCTSNRAREDLIVIDEAWIYLDNLALCEVMQGWARRLRKENAGLYIATQTADEMLVNNYTKAILSNSQWRLVMKTPESSVEAMYREDLVPNEYCKRLMIDVDMIPGEYAEVMIMTDGVYYVARLMLDPFSMALFTTSPDDVMAIKGLIQEGMSMEQAIESYTLSEVDKRALDLQAYEISNVLKSNPMLLKQVDGYMGRVLH